MKTLIRKIWKAQEELRAFYRQDRRSRVSLPLRQKLRMWRHGFFGEAALIYGKDSADLANYLSDYARLIKTPHINGSHSIYLDDKVLFETCFGRYVPIPRNLGIVVKGRFVPTGACDGPGDLDALLEVGREKGLVFRPISGGGGDYVLILRHHDQGFELNENIVRTDDVVKRIGEIQKRCVISEYVTQAAYSATIFPRTTNTIRVLTMVDPDTNVPFLVAAAHRFGNKDSAPVDNWLHGGLTARVDLETGVLGPGLSYPRQGKVIAHDSHPDTEAAITGVRVPGWATIRDRLLQTAGVWTHIPYIGWDVLVTDEGFVVIEGNSYTGVNILQVHAPLLSDPRVVRFYRHHGVIR